LSPEKKLDFLEHGSNDYNYITETNSLNKTAQVVSSGKQWNSLCVLRQVFAPISSAVYLMVVS
jgi:hypothetical protein